MHVRIYQNKSGTWTQIGKDIDGEPIVDPNRNYGDQSGSSVSLSSDGSVVAIGAPCNQDAGRNAGHVRVYKNQSGTWTQVGQDIDGDVTGGWYGSSVSLSSDGSIVAIGAPENNGSNSLVDAGHVRVFTTGISNVGVTKTKSEFTIYPNPTSKELRGKIESNRLGAKFIILNALGQELKKGELTSTMSSIDVSELPKGYYVLRIGDGNHSYKFLVE